MGIYFEDLLEIDEMSNVYGLCGYADCTVQELTDEELMDGVIIGEGDLWDALYRLQAGNVSKSRISGLKELESDINRALREFKFGLDLSDVGRLLLMPDESMEAWRKREFGED